MGDNALITKELEEKINTLTESYLDDNGKEVNSPVPFSINVTPKKMSIRDEIQKVMRTELSHQAMLQGMESFDDANDFDIDDEFDLDERNSDYELLEDEYPDFNYENMQGSNGEGHGGTGQEPGDGRSMAGDRRRNSNSNGDSVAGDSGSDLGSDSQS